MWTVWEGSCYNLRVPFDPLGGDQVMKTAWCVAIVAIVIGACSIGRAFGAEEAAGTDAWSASRLGKTRLGKVWMGPDVVSEDLRGQVVLMEFWGYRCGPCIASMPHLVKLNTKYRRRGLVVIGAHAQGPAKAAAVAIASARKVNYTILSM
ncbi:hypothetical protein LCGC14_2095620, partial [marine sediment metagenome]